jgi:nicotinamidase-related amidase
VLGAIARRGANPYDCFGVPSMSRFVTAALALCAFFSFSMLAANATIIDDWATVNVPPPPALQSVTVDSSSTALLLLDFVKQTCSGPRCTAAVPGVARLLQAARAKHVPVVYSYIASATLADTLPALAPLGTESSVVSGADKFLNTDLQQILAKLGVKTLIIAGVSANGAVLYTASHAALTGYSVIVPIDGAPSEVPYAEQYVVWHLANAPRVSASVKLTTTDRIGF